MHIVTEKLTGLPDQDLLIEFHDPTEFFTASAYSVARESGAVSTAITRQVGFGHDASRRKDGSVLGGRLLHIGRDTEWGPVMCSHFVLGHDLPEAGLSPDQITAEVDEALGPNLLQYAYDEFTFLSRILPPLYAAENRDELTIPRPW
jgi:hypothetical protein